jgi:hypothetical protein
VLAVTPLLTILFVELLTWLTPGLIAPERIAALGWAGAALVVGGSISVSLLGRERMVPVDPT